MRNKIPFDRWAVGVCRSGRMNFLHGWAGQQAQLRPERLEDYLGPDNPVRFLAAFVAALDLRAAGFLFPKSEAARTGRARLSAPPAQTLPRRRPPPGALPPLRAWGAHCTGCCPEAVW